MRSRRLILLTVAVLSIVCMMSAVAQASDPPKYVFFFIGDGMAVAQRTAADKFLKTEEGEDAGMLMENMPAYGMTTTYANDRFITGSAAAATALACGVKTNINYIGVDPDLNRVETVAEKARKQGMKVGIVSSVSIDHATPASFYAHQPTRSMYHEIDVDLATSGFDYFGGGGLKDPTGKNSEDPLGNALEMAKENGYTIVSDKEAFMALTKDSGKIIAYNDRLDGSQALPYIIDKVETDIILPEFTEKGIELLDNPNGFFMMVEGGKIDWSCHANDATTAILNTLAFDQAIQVAYEFYQEHPDETLIVVTGDHDCGGLSLGFAGTKYQSSFDLLSKQSISYDLFSKEVMQQYKESHVAGNAKFEDMLPLIEEYFGFKVEGEGPMVLEPYEIEALRNAFVRSMSGVQVGGGADYLLYGGYDPFTVELTHLLNHKAGLSWTSYSHTAAPVATSAVGVGAEAFNGFYDNTDIAKKIMSIMGLEFQEVAAVK
jgi:alkaline phosphatase